MTFAIPTLMPEDIECRVQQVKETQIGVGAAVLLYKNARVDMRILDDVFGPMNWQREHARDNANCIISVWDSEKINGSGKRIPEPNPTRKRKRALPPTALNALDLTGGLEENSILHRLSGLSFIATNFTKTKTER